MKLQKLCSSASTLGESGFNESDGGTELKQMQQSDNSKLARFNFLSTYLAKSMSHCSEMHLRLEHLEPRARSP